MAKKLIKLTESDLHRIIKESVNRILKETRLDYDEYNFSGRHTINNDNSYVDDDGYLDNPNEKPYFGGDKNLENEYSWYYFDKDGVTPNVLGNARYFRKGADKYIKKDIDDSLFNRDMENYWTKQDIEASNKLKNRWIRGKRSTDSIEDVDFDIDSSRRRLNRFKNT